jgi:hypothetical protein
VTLVLTEISPLGIAMATDSAVTYIDPATGAKWTEPNRQLKLHSVPSLNAGISCWGLGTIDGMQTDTWLANFISRHGSATDLTDLATRLATELNRMLGQNTDGRARMGCHVAGYLDDGLGAVPSIYHVHDGPSDLMQLRGLTVDPAVFNANHDCPPAITREAQKKGEAMIWRNGDWMLHAQIHGALETLFKGLRGSGIIIPMSMDLRDRADYLTFLVRTTAEIYRHSNLMRGIAGRIPFLAIGPSGIHSEGFRYV